jgi:hypothetical protein
LRGESYTARDHRWFAHADLRRAGGPRLFVQLSAAADSGRKPIARSFDRSAVDLAQAFVDLPLTAAENRFLLRIGRQELDLHGNRLVSTREAANLRRTFDMGLVSFARGGLNVLAFVGHAVANEAGRFDDRANQDERLGGALLELASSGVGETDTFTLFFFERTRPRAVFQDAVGPERRRTYGVRFAQSSAASDVALQAAYQSGRLRPKRIRAFGFAGDVGWRPGWELQPRFGVSFGYASGDCTVGDDTVGTFDVIYPNLGYFTDAPVFYPGNTMDVQPNVSANPGAGVTLQAGCDFIRRLEPTDAVYEPPGIPLVRGDGTGEHAAATLCFGKAIWRPTPRLEVTAAYVRARPDKVLRSAGGTSTDYLLAQVDWKL